MLVECECVLVGLSVTGFQCLFIRLSACMYTQARV